MNDTIRNTENEDILRGVLDQWKSAVDAHDPERVAAYFTDDAIFWGLHPYSVGRLVHQALPGIPHRLIAEEPESDRRSPGAGVSPRPGDDLACPETGEQGDLLRSRGLSHETGEIA
jgi:hypothetical protein